MWLQIVLKCKNEKDFFLVTKTCFLWSWVILSFIWEKTKVEQTNWFCCQTKNMCHVFNISTVIRFILEVLLDSDELNNKTYYYYSVYLFINSIVLSLFIILMFKFSFQLFILLSFICHWWSNCWQGRRRLLTGKGWYHFYIFVQNVANYKHLYFYIIIRKLSSVFRH